ncbi:TPA: hypothetical protein ACX6QF_002169 [Photobacterium damselae]
MPKVALDDSLFIEYFRFKNGKNSDYQLIESLLSHLKMPFVLSACQAIRCNQVQKDADGSELLSAPILGSLLGGGSSNFTMEELAGKSQYHLILTEDQTKFKYPYLNINKKNIELNYSKTCLESNSRKEIRDHLKSLCSDAINITICDNYFFSITWGSVDITTEKLFDDIFPKKKLTIQFVSNSKSVKKHTPLIDAKYTDWTVAKYKGGCYSSNNHDRYLIIEKEDKTVEVMLSSGFIYLWKKEKEITCIFRDV